MTIIFDGRKIASKKEKILREKWQALGGKKNKKLVDILIGESKASKIYLDLKKEAAGRVGINFEEHFWPASLTKKEVIAKISDLNDEEKVGGIMIQLPLPDPLKLAETEIVNAILPEKDVDCLTATNLGFLMMGKPRLLPATVRGIAEILSVAGLGKKGIIGKNACILGKSNIVGKPLANLLMDDGATVTVLNRWTKDIASFTKKADLLISATGEKDLIKETMVKKGVVVIDAGAPQGDVDFPKVAPLASFITPVPGGVGPMTVVSLLFNFYDLVSHCFFKRKPLK
jgi:methylenetetrahydrofolate dehydrogenase (NADP+)/methenyltetrahydrofolate cyclohydrolase